MRRKSPVHLIYEAMVVKRTERTGWQIMGENRETVGQHIFMTSVISYFLARETGADIQKVLIMSLFHDFHESRTGDLDKIATFYVKRDTKRANTDIFSGLDDELADLLNEYEEKKSKEAQVVYEANILALLVELKVLLERGNNHAGEWFKSNKKRLRLPQSIQLAKELESTDSQNWWVSIRNTLHGNFAK